MRTIHKYEIKVGDNLLTVPEGSKYLGAAAQGNRLCIWLMVDTDAPTVNKVFYVFGTGWDLDREDPIKFLSSIHQDPYVWHVFEEV